MAAGIAEREGLITLDEYIYPWFEKYFPSDPSENLYKIKIRDLLTMSSGQKDPLFFCDGPERYREKDWVRYFFQNDSFPIHQVPISCTAISVPIFCLFFWKKNPEPVC